ncbi:hypothetical protein LJR225_003639 [Phenylobacterium sp. LjRoot225]|uniref:hypothetical protein n=1 Tax=Phenylobacterium sp. LjRoot225 TaxID=3342285 RepID=UPI003ECF1207
MPDALASRNLASRNDVGLIKRPGLRELAARRRRVVVCGVLALALASSLIGVLADRHPEALGKPQTGPFSYFPSE